MEKTAECTLQEIKSIFFGSGQFLFGIFAYP
jgi:hypothetical protein